MPPESLYRFRTLKINETQEVDDQSLREITVPEIYLASPESLNDPFEFSVSSNLEILGNIDETIKRLQDYLKLDDLLDGDKEQVASRLIEELLRQTTRDFWNGVACFQDTNDCLLTWAHYGNGHSGICIEFDPAAKEFEAIQKVNYDKTAPDASEFIAAWRNSFQGAGEMDLARTFIWKYLTTKGEPWAYENEWRIVKRIEEKQSRLLQLDPAAIKAVYFGINIQDDRKTQIMKAINGGYQCFQARPNFGAYEISFDRI